MPLDGPQMDIPFITVDQMHEVDRAMEDDYHIELVQMMENAGLALANLASRRFLAGDPRGHRVLVMAGTGGNGGGGLVCARRLRNRGAIVEVWLTQQEEAFNEIPGHQLDILQRMGTPLHVPGENVELPQADLLIDALIGYSLRGAPRGPSAALIGAANAHGAPILSLDVPSGVDSDTGTVHEPSMQAAATLTLALPKRGFLTESAKSSIGELYLADISVPPELYERPPLGLTVGHIFAREDIVRIW